MKVAILGFGIEGKSVYKYFSETYPEYGIEVFDEINVGSGEVEVEQVDSFLTIDFAVFDIIVRSPSVSPVGLKKKIIEDKGSENDFELTSATKIFFDKCPAKIIGVTGTKGKGTTASFAAEILRAAGKKVHLIGNIGVAALDVLPVVDEMDVVVYELSSFQLWDLEKSPHVGVLTMLEPDHLDVHYDYREYIGAKLNIFKYQGADDYFVYDSGSFDVETEEIKSKKVDAVFDNLPNDTKELIKKNVKLPGEHNLQNAALAVLAAKVYDEKISDEAIAAGLSSFTGLDHRLKFVAEKSGVRYYDDSIATTPGSVIVAIKSFSEPKILILGGKDKGADYSEVADVANENGVKEIFVIGENRNKVVEQISEKYDGVITMLSNMGMDDIVNIVSGSAEAGDVVILSPAAASFDMFEDYKDRGEQFIDAVGKLT